MSEESNYWLRLQKSRVGRRRFLGGAATAGVGAAAFGLVGCGDDDDGGTTATGTTASGTTAAPAASRSVAVKLPGAAALMEVADKDTARVGLPDGGMARIEA